MKQDSTHATDAASRGGSELSEGLGPTPPLPRKKPAVFHHPMGFELYDGLAMDLHAMTYAEPLFAEIARLTAALKKANDQAERFERGWYLRGDALEVAVRQNEHDMLMTGEELRACRAALDALGPNVI